MLPNKSWILTLAVERQKVYKNQFCSKNKLIILTHEATSSTFFKKKTALPFELQWDHAKVLHLFQDWYPIRHHHEVTSSPWHLDSMDNLLSYKKINGRKWGT